MQPIRSINASPRQTARSWIARVRAPWALTDLGHAPDRTCSNMQKNEAAAGLPYDGLNPRALARALDYIRDHLCDSISLEDLAKAACISRFHFARQFRVATGLSPMEFVLNTRVEAGREILRRGELKISTLAVALGFFDQSHFTRAFRRVTGLAPRQFSRQFFGRDSRTTQQRHRPTTAKCTTEPAQMLNRSIRHRMRTRNAF